MVAILDRELRIRARQRRIYLVRFLIALGSSLATVLTLIFANLGMRTASAGSDVFTLLSWLLFGFCLLEGLRSAADSISEEKRAGTLGLLFLTDLSSAGIILGKTSGQLIGSLYALIAAIPALSIPIVLGGVTGGEFWRTVLALFVTLLTSLSLGILVSARVRGVMEAWAGTCLLLLVTLLVLPGASSWFGAGPAVPGAVSRSPFVLHLLRSDVFDLHPEYYWSAIGYEGLVILLSLSLACWVLPRRWHEPANVSGTPITVIKLKPAAGRDRLRHHRPLEWFAQHRDPAGRIVLWVSGVLAGGLIFWALTANASEIKSQYYVVGVAAFLYHTLLSIYQLLKATSLGSTLRTTGLLELVFITPLRPPEVVRGLGKGLLRQGIQATFIFGMGELLCLAILLARADALKEPSFGEVILVGIWAMLAMWPPIQDLWAGSWLGLYQGIRQAKTSRAVMIGFAWIQGLELLSYMMCLPVGPLFSLVKSLVIFLWARDRLLFELPRIVRADTVASSAANRLVRMRPLPSVIPPPMPPPRASQ